MLKANAAFSSFSVRDIFKTKNFYQEILGLSVEEDKMGGMNISLPQGGTVYVYQKDDHMPATYTVLNFDVDKIEDAMDQLKSQGVMFEHYEGMTDEKGIARGLGSDRVTDIAWFKDPDGNTFSIMHTKA